jgi:hypothetical protein
MHRTTKSPPIGRVHFVEPLLRLLRCLLHGSQREAARDLAGSRDLARRV